jgi:hypothetical protein
MRTVWTTIVVLLLVVSRSPAAPIDVFVMAGQSNMTGGGALADLPTQPVDLTVPQEDILYHYWIQAHELGVASEWVPLTHLKGEVVGTTYGPELTFGRALADQLPERKIAIIKVAHNGTDLAEDWHPNAQRLYQSLLDHVSLALRQLEDAGWDPQLKGFVWVQGEGDAGSRLKGVQYEENLKTFIGSLRAEWGVSDLPVVFNQLHVGVSRPPAGVTALRHSQEMVAKSEPYTAMVNIDDLSLKGDWVHFTGPTQLELGRRLADAYLTLASVPEPGTLSLVAVGFGWLTRQRLMGRPNVRPKSRLDAGSRKT